MAEKLENTKFINSASDLVTPRTETRAGFVAMALEKNFIAVPYIEEAKVLKAFALTVNHPSALLELPDLRKSLITASGLSDKSLNYLTEDDKTAAIKGLIETFLEPAGNDFAEELVYRYLLTKGDALGGKARNLAGSLGERKFLRSFLSVLNVLGIPYKWKDSHSGTWNDNSSDDSDIEKRIKAIYWKKQRDRILVLNVNVPMISKNVDLVLLESTVSEFSGNVRSLMNNLSAYIALGELKGGIDPAGADEHWKTANSALNRIRKAFLDEVIKPKTLFIGAAIENSMADEIYSQLCDGNLDSAANLTNDTQLTHISNWIVNQ